MIVQRTPRPFLTTSRSVELAAGLLEPGLIATERYDLTSRESYGTVVEVPAAEPEPGRPIQLEVSTFGPDATRLRFHRGAPPIAPLVLKATSQVIAPSAAGVTIVDDPFELRAAHGHLRTRPHDLHGLRAARDTSWPAHEQRWQVLHRHAYPTGTTTDDETGAGAPTWFVSFALDHDERIFGLGEDFGPLAKNGTMHELWVQEAFSNESTAVCAPVPFWWSTKGVGVLVNTTMPVRIDVGATNVSAVSLVVEGADQLDLVVIDGDTPADILATYHRLTGVPRIPPAWTFGVGMSRTGDRSQDDVEAMVAEMTARDLPCDVVHLDTHWPEEDWNCDDRFPPERFPDPEGMIRRLNEQGVRLGVWQWPNVLTSSTMYDECRRLDLLAKRTTTGEPYVRDGFAGPAAVLDWSNPDTVDWIAGKLRPLLEMGVSVITTDFGEGAPPDATYRQIDGLAMHNAYPALYNSAVMDVCEAVHGDEAVVWSRSGWAGSQRWPIHRSGDGVAQWSDLAAIVRSMLSIGLSGIPFSALEVGGIGGTLDAELYVRLAQLGVCSSHVRFHGFPPHEPRSDGDDVEEVEEIVRELLRLRKRLQPYLVEQASSATTGAPMCRAMVFADPHDPTCAFVDDQYLLGEDLLVAPILTPTGRRRVYVPRGEWLDWWSGERAHLGWHEVATPLDRFPLYVRAESALARLR